MLANFDDAAALAVPGVRRVLEVQPLTIGGDRYGTVKSGVAVLADSTWAAIQGRDALVTAWEAGQAESESSARIRSEFEALKIAGQARAIRSEGDAAGALSSGLTLMEAEYELPPLAHACMEPMNCTADVGEDRCEVWASVQVPRYLQEILATGLGLPLSAVQVHPTLGGGGFGRRLAFDYGVEAAMISRSAGVPVQVVWTREDDLQHDYYRTPSFHVLRAGLDGSGDLKAWRHHILSAPLNVHINGIRVGNPELYDVQGAADLPYGIENILVEFTPVTINLQMGSWRSVSHSFNVFVAQSFLDEIAAQVGADPLTFQLDLLERAGETQIRLPLPGSRGRPVLDRQKLMGVLRLAAERAGWRTPLPQGWGRGIACTYYKNSYAAHVAEVSFIEGRLRVERVVAALDCGVVVNLSGAEAQAEGSIMDGVATVLKWGVTIEGGRVQQSNFHQYDLLRVDEAPRVEVYFVPSERSPTGLGEPPYPSVAPAIVNAVFAVTGKRIRSLPLRVEDLA